jgi:hypothetical protein
MVGLLIDFLLSLQTWLELMQTTHRRRKQGAMIMLPIKASHMLAERLLTVSQLRNIASEATGRKDVYKNMPSQALRFVSHPKASVRISFNLSSALQTARQTKDKLVHPYPTNSLSAAHNGRPPTRTHRRSLRQNVRRGTAENRHQYGPNVPMPIVGPFVRAGIKHHEEKKQRQLNEQQQSDEQNHSIE